MSHRSITIAAFAFCFLALGCQPGGGSGSSGPPIAAPASLSGRTFNATVISGSGVFATRGTFRISFGATTYAVQGDGVNVANSNGTYSYSAIGSIGTALVNDSIGGPLNFAFTYTSSSGGTYAVNGSNGNQSGRFSSP